MLTETCDSLNLAPEFQVGGPYPVDADCFGPAEGFVDRDEKAAKPEKWLTILFFMLLNKMQCFIMIATLAFIIIISNNTLLYANASPEDIIYEDFDNEFPSDNIYFYSIDQLSSFKKESTEYENIHGDNFIVNSSNGAIYFDLYLITRMLDIKDCENIYLDFMLACNFENDYYLKLEIGIENEIDSEVFETFADDQICERYDGVWRYKYFDFNFIKNDNYSLYFHLMGQKQIIIGLDIISINCWSNSSHNGPDDAYNSGSEGDGGDKNVFFCGG